jgi:hypothetical protein
MESLLNLFLLFVAATTAMITYLLTPHIPVVVLTTAAAIVLAAGLWWHWTQFSVDYRTSTWQEQLRNFATYAIVLVVILVSYGFYIFAWKGESVAPTQSSILSSVSQATRALSSATASASASVSALFSEPAPVAAQAPAPAAAKPFSLSNFLS